MNDGRTPRPGDVEQALRESEERLKTVLEGIGEAFYAIDRDWRFLFASRSALKMWGKKPEEVFGQLFLEAFPHAEGSEPYEAHRRVMQTGVPEHFETVSPVLNRRIEVDLNPTPTGGLSVAFRDIEVRKRGETALRTSEERRELALQAANMGTWDYDLVADVYHFDARARKMYALPSDTLDHHPEGVASVVHPDDAGPMFNEIQKASDLNGDGRYDIDYRIAQGDGTYRWLRAWGKAEFEGEGTARRAVRIVGATRDVTTEKEAEAALRESERRLAAELYGTRLLHRLSTSLIGEQSREVLHEQILDAAQDLMQADAVSIQLLDPDGRRLRRLATRNLHSESAEYWTWVDASHASTCGQALRTNRRMVTEDVEKSAELAGTGDLEAFRRSGTRAVQSTPLVSRSGRPIGMISTHWHQPRRLIESDFGLFDILARQVGDLLEHSAAEAALRDSEEKFRSLFAASPAPFLIVKPDAPRFTIVEVNDAYLAATMRTREDLVGRGIFEAFPDNPDDATIAGVRTLRASLEHVLASRRQDSLPDLKYDIARPDGTFEERWWSPLNSPLLDENGEVKAIIHNAIDMTEEHRAGAALRGSEERYRSAARVGRFGSWETDFITGIRRWSPEGMELFGIDLPDGKGRVGDDDEWRSALDQGQADFPAYVYDAIQTQDQLRVEYRIKRPTGEVLWLVGHAEVLDRDANGKPLRLINVAADITERKRAEQALIQREAELARVQRIGNVGGFDIRFDTGPHGRRSPEYRRLHGLRDSVDDESHESWLARLHPEDREKAERRFREAIEGAAPQYVSEYRIIRPDNGEVRWIAALGDIDRDKNGRAIRMIGAHIDITERKEAEQKISNNEQRAQLLLAELQHRVRNTLSVVRSIARRTSETSETVEDYMQRLDGRLDVFSRTQALVTRDPLAGIDLEYLVAEELRAYGSQDGRQIKISGPHLRLQAKTAETMALVVHELATNALKYGALSESEGRLNVSWRVADSQVIFEWNEKDGPPSKSAIESGFGTELLKRVLPYELGARSDLRFPEKGFECSVWLPLEERLFKL